MLNYGIIGNSKTSALVSSKGSIDWLCFPIFSSPPAFAKILDKEKGGEFSITPVGDYQITQRYIKNTNVLETAFKGKKVAFRVKDFFPFYKEDGKIKNMEELHRLITLEKGKPVLRICYNPKLDYARSATKIRVTKNSIVATNGSHKLHLYSNLKLKTIRKEDVSIETDTFFVLGWGNATGERSISFVQEETNKTIEYWKDYARSIPAPKFQGDALIRSALLIKLLSFRDSGGIVESATTSIPEVAGGRLNWDKRYCWIKNQRLAIEAFSHLRMFKEMDRVLEFLTSVGTAYMMEDGRHGFGMQGVYGPDGNSFLKEETLEHLTGYNDSVPVRIGNDAYLQRNISVFGEMLDAIYKFLLAHGSAELITESHPALVEHLVGYVRKHWREKDRGAWEFRTLEEEFTYSKLMAWVAIDRGIKVIKMFYPLYPMKNLKLIRDEIRESIMENYNEDARAFTLFKGSDKLDMSLLSMSKYGFLEPDDRRFVNTVKAIEKELKVGPFSKIHKVDDGFGTPKNAYMFPTMCLIDALSEIGEEKKARILFEKVLRFSNHLGIYSECIDLLTLELLGNFPSASAHMGIISTISRLYGNEVESEP